MKFLLSLGTSSHISVYDLSVFTEITDVTDFLDMHPGVSLLSASGMGYTYVILPDCYLLFLFNYCNFFRFCHAELNSLFSLLNVLTY